MRCNCATRFSAIAVTLASHRQTSAASDAAQCQIQTRLLNDLIGRGEQRRRNSKAERLGRLEIYHHTKLHAHAKGDQWLIFGLTPWWTEEDWNATRSAGAATDTSLASDNDGEVPNVRSQLDIAKKKNCECTFN